MVVFLASLVIPFLELLGPFPLVVTTRLVIAAIVAGTLVYNRLQEFGPTITIKFRDGSGVKADQTEIRYRGVPVGQVTTVELSPDHEHVVMTARLFRGLQVNVESLTLAGGGRHRVRHARRRGGPGEGRGPVPAAREAAAGVARLAAQDPHRAGRLA